jgi:hypothetical protein
MRKDLIVVILGTFCLTVTLFTIIPIRSQTTPEYDPWKDITDDGYIGIDDIVLVAESFGGLGDPTKNVNVTNWPVASSHLTVILNETYLVPVGTTKGPMILSASNKVVGIGGISITFLSGGVSGGATWQRRSGYNQYAAGGGSPGAGRVEVYDSNGTLLVQFALPLNSMITVQNVDRIKVYGEAPIPYLESTTLGGIDIYSDYSAFVIASVYWIEN